MGKRSDFERNPRDYYITPKPAVLPLLPFLRADETFYEPCAGNGQLAQILMNEGFKCVGVSDIDPQNEHIPKIDVFDLRKRVANVFITNPPWDRRILHPLIIHLSDISPTWLLFDADWPHTKQSSDYMQRCAKIVSIGRVKWFPETNMTGKDNCCWYLFDKNNVGTTIFIGRK